MEIDEVTGTDEQEGVDNPMICDAFKPEEITVSLKRSVAQIEYLNSQFLVFDATGEFGKYYRMTYLMIK